MADVSYVLLAKIDSKLVYAGNFPDSFEIQDNGLDAADEAVSAYLNPELEPEETSYLLHKKTEYEKNHISEGNMERESILFVLGVLVQSELLTRAAADHYAKVLDQNLENGTTVSSLEKSLEVLNA